MTQARTGEHLGRDFVYVLFLGIRRPGRRIPALDRRWDRGDGEDRFPVERGSHQGFRCTRTIVEASLSVTRTSVGNAEHPWPHPAMSLDTAFFWEGTAAGELRIQRCASCGTLRHPPRPCCAACLSFDWDHVVAGHRGEIVSFVVHHYPPIPPFEPPYVVALVGLPEGVRLVGNVLDAGSGDVAIGMGVTLELGRVSDDLVLPQWRLDPDVLEPGATA